MSKFYIFFFVFIVPALTMAQVTITGRVVNPVDKKPVENVNVFLSNTSVGDKTNRNGEFTLKEARPGKYELVASIIGFESYRKNILVGNDDIKLSAIEISPKTIALKQVNIKPVEDVDRDYYFSIFKDEFLGRSALSNDCKIINPELLDFVYDKKTSSLTASSVDFLVIENRGLGYRVKYLLNNFKVTNRGQNDEIVHYEGSVLFEKMKGSADDEKNWQKARQRDYEGSPLHFFRSIQDDRIGEGVLDPFFQQGFWALRLAKYPNPDRPADSLIDAKINYYKKLKSDGKGQPDSLAFWVKKHDSPKTLDKLLPDALHKEDMVKPTDQPGIFALGFTRSIYSLFINYDTHRFDNADGKPVKLNIKATTTLADRDNTDNTLVTFNEPHAFFDKNGALISPNSLTFQGVWGRRRLADLLPVDYVSMPDDKSNDDNLISKINAFTNTHLPEKAYLQFDKPYYAAGDTLYFKAYVTKGEAHLPTDISGVLHVDLINGAGKIDQSIKLNVDSGQTWGDFALPDSLPQGSYRIRAYTRWMQNEGEGTFFNRTFTIGSTLSAKIPESGSPFKNPLRMKPDVQVMPEGGTLVAGIETKIAFKAIGANGLGIPVQGIVVDNSNRLVCTFASAHLGMGYFMLKADADKTYTAIATHPGGQVMVNLPQPVTKAISLTINNDSLATAIVTLKADSAFYKVNKGKDFSLVVSSGDINTKINCTLTNPNVKIEILKQHLHTGVARFTLFSPKGEPMCERLIFVQNNDQLKVHISTDQPEYAKRGKVRLKLKATTQLGDAATAHFSVSVTDESKVPVDKLSENTIMTGLMLTSDLKGHIEQPNYYFTDTSDAARKNLDILMLTQGYSHFEWAQVLSDNKVTTYQPEKGIEISGAVTNLFGKPISKGTVTLLPQHGQGILSTVTDDKGVYRFQNLAFNDTTRFMLSAVNGKGKNATKLTYFGDEPLSAKALPAAPATPTIPDTAMAAYLNNRKKQQDDWAKYGGLKGKQLREVKIKARKEDEYKSLSLVPDFAADAVVHGEDLPNNGGSVAVALVMKVHGVHLYDVNHVASNITKVVLPVIIDGLPGGSLADVSADRIESIYLLLPPTSYVYGQDGKNGLLIVTTRPVRLKDIPSSGVLPINATGFYKARQFYTPKYEHPELTNAGADLRSTIYWNPSVATDKNGNATMDFFNADGIGNYRVVIEGMDENGNLGRQVYRYRVSE